MDVELIIKIFMPLVSAVITIGAAITGWVFKVIFADIKQLERDLEKHRVHAAESFATKTEVSDLGDRVMDKLDRMEKVQFEYHASLLDRLSNKADR